MLFLWMMSDHLPPTRYYFTRIQFIPARVRVAQCRVINNLLFNNNTPNRFFPRRSPPNVYRFRARSFRTRRFEIARRHCRHDSRLARISAPINHNYANSGPSATCAHARACDSSGSRASMRRWSRASRLVKIPPTGTMPANKPLSSFSQRVDYPRPPWNFGTGRPLRDVVTELSVSQVESNSDRQISWIYSKSKIFLIDYESYTF